VFPILAPELITAREDELRRQAEAGPNGTTHGKPAGGAGSWRLALGNRLVAMGSRIRGEPKRGMEAC
jgi:hypothetical protein